MAYLLSAVHGRERRVVRRIAERRAERDPEAPAPIAAPRAALDDSIKAALTR